MEHNFCVNSLILGPKAFWLKFVYSVTHVKLLINSDYDWLTKGVQLSTPEEHVGSMHPVYSALYWS